MDVERGSAAELAGLRANDRILQVDEFKTLGANPQPLAQELAAGGPNGQRILRVSRQLGMGLSVFSLALKTEASTPRKPGPMEPRWIGQMDSDGMKMEDGSKRDRDLFEQGADLVDGLWAPPPKARIPPARPARLLVEPKPKRDSMGLWDPFGNLLPDFTSLPAAHHPRTAAQRQPKYAGQRQQEADSEFARKQRLGHMSTKSNGFPPAARATHASADALWYLVQLESYPTRKIAALDEQTQATPEGSLDVVLFEAYDLPIAAAFGLADAYCTADLGRSRLSTRVINNELNPTFNTILRFRAVRCESITIRIMNKTLLGDSQIGLVSVSWDEAQRGRIKEYPVLSSTGSSVNGVHKTPSRLRLQVRIGPGTVIDLASRGVHTGQNDAAAPAQGPPHLSATDGVTLTLAEDYLTAKNREGTWRHELARDVCAALQCNPSRFQYVGMRSGSILASFNLLSVAPGDADKRTARNLASELALQVYDVSSPLRCLPTTAKAINVTLHPPQAPRDGGLPEAPGHGAFLHTLPPELQPPELGALHTLNNVQQNGSQDTVTPDTHSVPGPRDRVLFGTNAYSAILEKSIGAFGLGNGVDSRGAKQDSAPPGAHADSVPPAARAPGDDPRLWQQKQHAQGASVPRGSIARPVFGTDALVPLLDKMFQPATGAPAASAPAPDLPPSAATALTPPAPAAPVASQAQQASSIAAIRMKLAMPFDQCGMDGSVQRHMFKQEVTSDLAMASKLPASCFNIVSVSPGSILVDAEIDVDPNMAAASRDPLVAALDLQGQASVQDSSLKRGKITCHCEGIDVFQVQRTLQRQVQGEDPLLGQRKHHNDAPSLLKHHNDAPPLLKLKPAPYVGQPAKFHSSGESGVAPAREVVLSVHDVNLPELEGQRVFMCASVVGQDYVAHHPSALGDIVPQFTSPEKTGSGVVTVINETLSFTQKVLGGGAQGALKPLDGRPVQILLTLHASAQPAPALAQALVPATMHSSMQEHEFPLVDMNLRQIFLPSNPRTRTEGQVLKICAPTNREQLKEAFADYVAQEIDELRCQLACVSAGVAICCQLGEHSKFDRAKLYPNVCACLSRLCDGAWLFDGDDANGDPNLTDAYNRLLMQFQERRPDSDSRQV